ncbi:MAG: hydrolase 1, exosortase A system-associated [Steroidobacteraceae bacterium]|nr:hydrolase 1, exosortase A system-associated [Steroidobacteraceae bacterium]MDW8260045.1 hydrolase 1, exosortase A system-associated [Gammaproteobacteria bacterium]
MFERCLIFDCENEKLVGILHEPSQQPQSIGILIIVGGPQYRVGSHRQFVLMARALAAAGYTVLRFDCRGMGDSTGQSRTFESIESDIAAAIDAFFRSTPQLQRIVPFGLCDAASAALMFCGRDSRVAGLVMANPWAHAEPSRAKVLLRHYYPRRIMQPSFWFKWLRGAGNFRNAIVELFAYLKRALSPSADRAHITDYRQRMAIGLREFNRPVLLLMSGRDLTAREFELWANGDSTWRSAAARADIKRVDLPQADHTFSTLRDLQEAIAAILRWVPYLQKR